MKKIKKEVPIPARGTNDLLDFLRADKQEVKEVREKPINYKDIPSKKPEFRKWKRIDIEAWKGNEFVGYYLHKYVEVMNEEDPDFKRANTYSYAIEKRIVNECLKHVFDGDKMKFKEYMDFIIPWWVSDESFVEPIPSFKSIFTQKGTFYKKFLAAKNAKPKKQSRKELDNHYASADAWAEFLEDE